jgi:hypothetical protein
MLVFTLLGKNPGPSEAEEQGDYIKTIATIMIPDKAACNLTAGPLLDC